MWWARLTTSREHPLIPARDLYCGEHWSLAMRTLARLRDAGRPAQHWVASAGYGLLPTTTPITPYSATFACGQPDSVHPARTTSQVDASQVWWQQLGCLALPKATSPRSVHRLARTDPRAALVVVASPDYIRAMRRDLLAARDALATPHLLTLISNRSMSADLELSPHLVPVDERCRTVLGGTMVGLNARTALSLIEWAHEGPLTAPRLRERYESMVSGAERPPMPNRERIDDEDVVAFLRAELARSPRAGWALLLRTLRGRGRACEQARFRELHRRIRDEAIIHS